MKAIQKAKKRPKLALAGVHNKMARTKLYIELRLQLYSRVTSTVDLKKKKKKHKVAQVK